MSINSIVLKPIGFVKHVYSDEYVRNSLNGVEGYIEVLSDYKDGLKGLEGFSHIIILAYLHKVSEDQRKTLVVKPRGLGRKFGIPLDQLPEVGVFATDSPHRPNPIALTIARLIEINVDRGVLYVSDLDLFSGTPVLDIKPYTYARQIKNADFPQWYKNIVLHKITKVHKDE